MLVALASGWDKYRPSHCCQYSDKHVTTVYKVVAAASSLFQ